MIRERDVEELFLAFNFLFQLGRNLHVVRAICSGVFSFKYSIKMFKTLVEREFYKNQDNKYQGAFPLALKQRKDRRLKSLVI